MADTNQQRPPKIRKIDDSRCVLCNHYVRKIAGCKRIKTRDDARRMHELYGIFIQAGEVLCQKCYLKLRLQGSSRRSSSQDALAPSTSLVAKTEQQETAVTDQEMPSSEVAVQSPGQVASGSQQQSQVTTSTIISSQSSQPSTDDSFTLDLESSSVECVEMPFNRVLISHAYCFICKSKTDLHDVPFAARMQVFVKRRIFIPKRNRCCSKHLIKNRFYENEVDEIQIFSNESSIEVTEVAAFMEKLSDEVNFQLHDYIGKYAISEERVKALTGYSWNDITVIKNMLVSMKNSENRNLTQAVVIFLYKLRSGSSNNLISATLGIDEKIITASINSVLKSFEKDVLPKNFGINAHSREELISQTSPVAKKLHNIGNRLALICDATYIRHEKSANNIYQRKSYSGQKKTALCKPFTICTTNGFVVDVFGPFNATKNDAQILEHLLKLPDGLNNILKEGDIFILDRGFRDVKPLLEQKGFEVLMPALKGHRNQLTTEESNQSRLVTKLRWVVEAVHGIIGQKCKLLHHQLNNLLLPNAGLFCRIACFLQNTFGKRLNSDKGNVDQIIERINLSLNNVNSLSIEVEENNWSKKTRPFAPLSSNDLLDFPEMTLTDLEIFFTGSYQLKQSISYLAEMLDENDSLVVSYLKEMPNIIKFEVRSRHINSKTYKCYIHYEPNSIGMRGIKRYCCSCANGNRTVGCCSHVAALIYYLSNSRYSSRIVRPAEKLRHLFDFDEVRQIGRAHV